MIAPGMGGLLERAALAGETRAARRRQAIAEEAGALGGVRARVEGEVVVIEGRGLLDRWIRNANLRNIGRTGL